MGYMHIDNLYKDQTILIFRECYALEKIHGTSAHIAWSGGNLTFFSGGEKHENFLALFDQEKLKAAFAENGHDDVTVFGEAYGGKQQGMSATYGKQLKFIVFDVKCGESWLEVPTAAVVASNLGLEFVHYVRTPTDVAALDALRDTPSVQAARNGILEAKPREGVVLRPIKEFRLNNGARIIAKHKGAAFAEREHQPKVVDADKQAILIKADEIAFEWVTDMRLTHVLDKLGNPTELSAIPNVIKAMLEDVTREAAGEIVESKEARKAIGNRAMQLFKTRVTQLPK